VAKFELKDTYTKTKAGYSRVSSAPHKPLT
jgi:hypothetical protein